MPSMKSTWAPDAGRGSGSQRMASGGVGTSPKWLCQWRPAVLGKKGSRSAAAGRMRYSQVRRLAARGAVKAVPLSCSAYRPSGATWGELRPTGSAPAMASVAHSLAKPVM